MPARGDDQRRVAWRAARAIDQASRTITAIGITHHALQPPIGQQRGEGERDDDSQRGAPVVADDEVPHSEQSRT